MTQTLRPQSQTIRRRLAQFVDSAPVQNVVLAVIIVNAVVIAMATTAEEGTTTYGVLHVLDTIALVIFVIELVMKLVAYGPKRFFSDGWSVFDFIVVGIALVPSAGPLSVLRALRVLRVLRVIKFLPQVRMVVEALVRSFPGIGAIALLMSLVFFVASVMSTELFGDDFPQWFGDIGKSMYSLFQIMTLESWSMGIVRPVMEVMPYAWVFFIPFILIAAFITLNLFIAVIVDTMQALRVERDHSAQSQSELESPLVALDLSDDELAMVTNGLTQLSARGAAQPDVLRLWAIDTKEELRDEVDRIQDALADDQKLSLADWERTLFASEFALLRGMTGGPTVTRRAADDQAALTLSRSIRSRFDAHGAASSITSSR